MKQIKRLNGFSETIHKSIKFHKYLMIRASLALEEFELSVVEIKYCHPFEECIVDGGIS